MELVKFREAKSIMEEKAFLQKTLKRFQSGHLSRTDLYFSSGSSVTFSEVDGESYEDLLKNFEKFIREYIENRIGYLESKFDKL
jgi:hypothetical protein